MDSLPHSVLHTSLSGQRLNASSYKLQDPQVFYSLSHKAPLCLYLPLISSSDRKKLNRVPLSVQKVLSGGLFGFFLFLLEVREGCWFGFFLSEFLKREREKQRQHLANITLPPIIADLLVTQMLPYFLVSLDVWLSK